jgi:hypothetical protein
MMLYDQYKMSRSSITDDKKYVYILIEQDNDVVNTRIYEQLYRACLSATTWVDNYYISVKKSAPSKLPTSEDIIKLIKPNGPNVQVVFYSSKKDNYTLTIKRSCIH